MIAPARRAAFEVLLGCEARGGDLPGALATARRGLPEARDQALLTELVNGTVRMRLALDHQIAPGRGARWAGRSEVLSALRLARFS